MRNSNDVDDVAVVRLSGASIVAVVGRSVDCGAHPRLVKYKHAVAKIFQEIRYVAPSARLCDFDVCVESTTVRSVLEVQQWISAHRETFS